MKKESFYAKKTIIIFAIFYLGMLILFCLRLKKSLELKRMQNLQSKNITAMENSNLQEINGISGDF